MKYTQVLISVGMGLCCLSPTAVVAQSLIKPSSSLTLLPVTTFEVIDGINLDPDGQGDADGVFPGNFDTVVLGGIGESGENAEYDLSKVTIPIGYQVKEAVFKVTVTPNQTFGFGAGPKRSSGLVVRGYQGNGVADASDFQAGRILDRKTISPTFVFDTVSFNVTRFVRNSLERKIPIVGFGVRAKDIGAQSLARSGQTPDIGPRLIITIGRR
jgi:hypothetical protein